ncbi:hypothetical protein [Saccharothrix syringae]|nr:hypothetical protein [Saccharothrix syringae]
MPGAGRRGEAVQQVEQPEREVQEFEEPEQGDHVSMFERVFDHGKVTIG